jgi:hypothetical protein
LWSLLREMLLGQHREAQDQQVAFEPAAAKSRTTADAEMVALLNPALAAAA